MPRIPFDRVRKSREVPYVYRSATHQAIRDSVEQSQSIVLTGVDPQVGVSRTIIEAFQEFEEHRFSDGLGRKAICLDLFLHADYSLAEILYLLRNRIVKAIDQTIGLPNIEIYFFDVDIIWAIWKQMQYGGQRHEINTYRSRYRRLTGSVARKIAAITTGGIFEVLDIFQVFGEAVEGFGESISKPGLEIGSESWLEIQGEKAGAYFMAKLAPRLSRSVRAAIDTTNPSPDGIALAMLDLTIKAIDRVALRLLKQNRLSIAIDAIDEINGPDSELVVVRAAICKLLYDAAPMNYSTILAGRGPANLWFAELEGAQFDTIGPLGPLNQQEIENAWAAVVDPRLLSSVVQQACRSQSVATAGQLAEAWRVQKRAMFRGGQ